jgi:hypothetical protein
LASLERISDKDAGAAVVQINAAAAHTHTDRRLISVSS